MSTVAAARTRSALLRVAVPSADVVALTLLAVLAAACIGATWGSWGALDNDTGYDFVTGARVADGQLPYVDFPYWYGPLAPALLGLAAWLGGGGIGSFVALGFLIAAAIVVAGYLLARLVAGPVAAAFATAITVPVALAPNQFSFVLPHTSAATLGLLCLLGVLLALGAAHAPDRRGALVAAGTCAGLASLTKPEFAFAALAAAAAWFALGGRGTSGLWRRIALFAAPALAIPAVVYGAFLTAVSPGTLLFDNLYPSDFLSAAGNTLLEARAPFTAESLAEAGGRLVLYAAGAGVLVVLARALAKPGRQGQGALVVVVGCAGVAAAASVLNPEALRHGLQFVWGWVPAGAIVAAAVVALRVRRRRTELGAARTELALLVALAAFGATTYAGFFLYAPNAQTAVYAVPLAAAFLTRLHLVELVRSPQGRALGLAWLAFVVAAGVGLTFKDARIESEVVRGPGGALHASPAEARAYRAALGWIETRTEPGDAILLAPQLTWLYTLSARENPLPDISLLPGALGGGQGERAAVARLDNASVRLAVIDRRPFPVFDHTSFGGSFNRELDAWVRRSFSHAATLRSKDVTLEVWLRRTT